jgi:hypothetical protein
LRTLIASFLLGCAAAAAAPSAFAQAQDKNTAAITEVMSTFHRDVATHNGAALTQLFLPEAHLWLNVLSENALATATGTHPSKVKVSSPEQFAKFVSSSTAALDPQHTGVVIHTDGTVAAVYFHYQFLIDGKVQNRGDETWQLVQTTDGWRIAAIVYSSNPAAL